ncbi:hypothetical protein [Halovivax limisalsi]|uniref:hypothetical protein n=1 Tax=Halovivax limisalsi TaxID=1453760 RepID=UPI001FFDE703|nr:hypothetical protein [Halovivax limisalsi]
MSENDTMTEVVVEEATERLDVRGLVDGESLQDQVDSARVGRAVGARLGEAAGRQLGAAVGRRVHETLADVDRETNPRDLGRGLAGAVRGGVSDAVSTSRERGSALATLVDSARDAGLGSALAELLEGEPGESETEASKPDETESEPEGQEPDSHGETDELDSGEAEQAKTDTGASEGEETDSDGEPVEDEVDEIDAEDVEVDDLESFQTDTLRAYLETISYRDLQSIAKDLDVKANLARDEMTDRILETAGDGDES